MEKTLKSIGVFIAIITISFLALHSNNAIGTYKENIEMDARSSQKVPVGWQVSKDTTQTMSAMIFYDESRINHTFSIYINRPGLSFGYFFRSGGSIADGVTEFDLNGSNERAFVSMNKQQISKVVIDNGSSIQTLKIQSTKPFAFILPINIGTVTLYDINGNVVESQRQGL